LAGAAFETGFAALMGAAFAGAAFLAAGAGFLAGAAGFLAAAFFAGTGFFAAGFFTAGFLAGAAFFAAGLATGFFAADFFGAALAAGFLVALAAFFAGFFAATSGVSSVPSNDRLEPTARFGRNSHCGSIRTARVGGTAEKSNAPFVSPCSVTLYLESALLYPAPATAATALQDRFFPLKQRRNGPTKRPRTHCRQ
jgi:hypothetical protein